MQVRIYFLLVLVTSVIIASFKDGTIASLRTENEALRQSVVASAGNVDTRSRSNPKDPAASFLLQHPSIFSAFPDEAGQLTPALGLQPATNVAEKITLMETQLRRYRNEAAGYQMMIDALKNEIHIRDEELAVLNARIAEHQSEKQALLTALRKKELDLSDVIAMANGSRQESATLQKRIQQLSRDLRLAEADACYARARITELAAQKMWFSRPRKTAYLSEALEGYRKAYSMGKQEASENILALEKSLFHSVAVAD